MLSLSWRYVYLGTFALRFILALSESYIHPDEHFQSFEVAAQRFLAYNTNPPWEYEPTLPARSLAPLYLVYYVPLKVLLSLGLSPLQIWLLVRLLFMLVSWVVTDWCLYKMLPSKQERIKAIFFVLTSFVTLVFQSHTFSNSVETLLVVATTWMINELRFLRATETNGIRYSHAEIARYSAAIGGCFALGIFNRITFPAFFILPGFHYLECCWKWRYIPVVSLAAFAVLSGLFIVIDTAGFSDISVAELARNPFAWGQYIVAPLNNLLYNTQYLNLALHGIHPWYTHVLVNFPQILGPGIIFLFPNLRNCYWKTTPFMAAISGVLFLSAVPHQELRFLIPVVPLLCCCFDVAAFKAVSESRPWLSSLLMVSWLLFNAVMSFVMGVMHQGGVVPALSHIHDQFPTTNSPKAYIWWRTYTPPTWIVGDVPRTQSISVSNQKSEVEVDENAHLVIIDAQGMEFDLLKNVVSTCKDHISDVYVVVPTASSHFLDGQLYNLTWSHGFHLDLDHLDFSELRSLRPGLGIYHLL